MEIDNITIRKRKTNDSFDCSFISHRSDCKRHSLPDLSIGYDSDTDELREEIKNLQKKLDSANGEIDNLNYEIYNLSKKLKDQQKTIENLKKLATESTTSTKKYNSTKKIVKRQLRKDNSLEELNKSFQELQIRNDSLTQSKQTQTYGQIQEQYFQSTNNKCIKSQLLPQDDTAGTQTNNLNKPTNKESKNNFEKKIFIIGSQQCVGLSSHLIISRQQSRYNKYNISSITKPYATAEEILKSCYKLQPNESNYVILCVGENDTNPTKLSIELSSALRYMRNLNIILLSINKNNYLNTVKLNQTLKIMCNNMNNCNFIYLSSRLLSKKQYFDRLCYKINLLIDSKDYSNKFLKFKASKTILSTVHKPGTIPYYFMKMQNALSTKKQIMNISDQSETHQVIQKGTIPYYFKKINKKEISTNISLHDTDLKQKKIIPFVNLNELNDKVVIFHQNIARLLKKLLMVEICINELTETHIYLNVLCFTETFIKSGHENNINLKKFRIASSYGRLSECRGGVCILVRKQYEFNVINYCNEISVEKSFECCGVEIPYWICIIICLYRTPNSNAFIFFNKLQVLLNKLSHIKNKKIVIAGDFNINTLVNNKLSIELKGILANYNLKSHILGPTRKTSCLDHIASNIPNAIGKTHVLHLSDHDTAQTLEFTPAALTYKFNSHYFIFIRDYNKEYITKFRQCLSSISWKDVIEDKDVNSAFNNFHETLIMFYDLCFPTLRINIKRFNSVTKWITKGIKKSCCTKRKLMSLFFKNKTDSMKTHVRTYSKILKSCIIKAKSNTNNNFINKAKNKCKATWNLIKESSNDLRKNKDITSIHKNETLIKDPGEIANIFNSFFTNLPKKTMIKNKSFPLKYVNVKNNSIFLQPCSAEEIKKIIQGLNNTNSVGYDGISTKILKSCADLVSPVLSYIINISFEYGIFPNKLKISVIKPIHKAGSKKEINNYRPIALIPILAKVFEKAMHTRLNSFLNKHKILREEQNGFQKEKSTTLANYTLTQHITENIDKGMKVTGVFFDMSKAFDFVDHELLLNKIEKYGIRGLAFQWIQSYLSDRTQCVQITRINEFNEHVTYSSKLQPTTKGVPQGTILGPLLFILYINDLPLAIDQHCTLYADDVSVIITGKEKPSDYELKVNNTVTSTINWLESNNLCPNLLKTKYITFCTNRANIPKIKVVSHNQEIEKVAEIKFLGLILDQHCSWKSHISLMCDKLDKFVYALKRLTNITSKEAAITAYHGYVASVLRYGLLIWGNSTVFNRAFLIQKKCVRAICGCGPFDSCKPLFKQLKLMTLCCMYVYEIGTFVKKYPHLFQRCIDNYTDKTFPHRDVTRLNLRKCKTVFYQKSCPNMCIRVYNKIPSDIRKLPFNFFQKTLKQWLIQNCFYSLDEFYCYRPK